MSEVSKERQHAITGVSESSYFCDVRSQSVVSFSRFTQSFKKGFASQEYRSLRRRVEAPLGGLPEAVCLVAVPPDGGGVVGTLDLRPPACAAGSHPKGVPKVGTRF